MPQCEWPGASIVQKQVFLLLIFKAEKIQKSNIKRGFTTNILSRKAYLYYPDTNYVKNQLWTREVHFSW